MRIVNGDTQYPALDLREASALDTAGEVIQYLESKMGKNTISFENYYNFNRADLERILQLFYCLQKQMDIDFISVDK